MMNVDEIVGFQFDLQLPEGVQLVTDANGNYIASLTSRKDDHSLSVSKVDDNTYRFVSVSMNNQAFGGTDGALLTVRAKVDEGVAPGYYDVKVSNAELTTADKDIVNAICAETAVLTVKEADPGDVNGDMKVSVTDVQSIIGYILNDRPAYFIESAANVNGDNKISVTDAVMVIDMILNQGNTSESRRKNIVTKEPQ